MSDRPSIKDVAQAAGVAKSTVSCVLNGKAEKFRISDDTQARILAVARQMNYHPDDTARNIALGNAVFPTPARTESRNDVKPAKQIGLVLSAASPASSLTLIPGLDPVFSAAGYRLTVITVPNDLAAAHERLSSALADGIAGLLACPTVYSTVLESVGNTCPVIVLWQDAAKAILEKISGSVEVEAPRAQPPAPVVSRAPVTPPPVVKAPPITVVPPVVAAVTGGTPPDPVPQRPPAVIEPTPQPAIQAVPAVAPEVTPLPEPAPIPVAEAVPDPEPTIEEAPAVSEEPTPAVETPTATTPVADEVPPSAAEPVVEEVPPVATEPVPEEPEPVAETPVPENPPSQPVSDPVPATEPIPVVVEEAPPVAPVPEPIPEPEPTPVIIPEPTPEVTVEPPTTPIPTPTPEPETQPAVSPEPVPAPEPIIVASPAIPEQVEVVAAEAASSTPEEDIGASSPSVEPPAEPPTDEVK